LSFVEIGNTAIFDKWRFIVSFVRNFRIAAFFCILIGDESNNSQTKFQT